MFDRGGVGQIVHMCKGERSTEQVAAVRVGWSFSRMRWEGRNGCESRTAQQQAESQCNNIHPLIATKILPYFSNKNSVKNKKAATFRFFSLQRGFLNTYTIRLAERLHVVSVISSSRL